MASNPESKPSGSSANSSLEKSESFGFAKYVPTALKSGWLTLSLGALVLSVLDFLNVLQRPLELLVILGTLAMRARDLVFDYSKLHFEKRQPSPWYRDREEGFHAIVDWRLLRSVTLGLYLALVLFVFFTALSGEAVRRLAAQLPVELATGAFLEPFTSPSHDLLAGSPTEMWSGFLSFGAASEQAISQRPGWWHLLLIAVPVLLAFLFSTRLVLRKCGGLADPTSDYPYLKIVLATVGYGLIAGQFSFWFAIGHQPRAAVDPVGALKEGLLLVALQSAIFGIAHVCFCVLASRIEIRLRPRISLWLGYLVVLCGAALQVDPSWSASAWTFSAFPFLMTLPMLVVGTQRDAKSRPRRGRLRKDWRERKNIESFLGTLGSRLFWATGRWLTERLPLDVTRGSLLLGAIVRRNLPTFVMGMFVSMTLVPGGVVWAWLSPGPPIPPIPLFQKLVLVNIWALGTMSWVSPLITSLVFLDETLSQAYDRGLRHAINDLEQHVLILGYGDFGRRVGEGLLEKKIIPYSHVYEHLRRARNILLPNGNLGKVLLRIAVITRDEVALSHVTKLGGPPIAVSHISSRSAQGQNPGSPGGSVLTEIVIPVVVGDAISEEVQNTAEFTKAAFIASTMRGATKEPSLAILDRLTSLGKRGQLIPAALTLHSSSHVHYVAERVMKGTLPVHWILTSHLEGLNVATHVHGAASAEYACGGSPRILVCGRGTRLLYFIDSFVKGAAPTFQREWERRWKMDWVKLVVMTDDASLVDLRGEAAKRKKWQRLVSRQTEGLGRTPFEFEVERNSGIGYHALMSAMKKHEPTIVVILDHESDAELRLMHQSFANAYRNATDGATMPLVFVSGETGEPHLRSYFRDALAYYAGARANTLTASPEAASGPRQGLDLTGEREDLAEGAPFVDVLDDPAERVVSLAWAYLDKQRGDNVAELNFCETDVPAAIAHRLAGLAGFRFEPSKDHHQPLSFANTRFIPIKRDEFLIKSFVYWIESHPAEADACQPGGSTHALRWNPPARLALVGDQDRRDAKAESVAETVLERFYSGDGSRSQGPERRKHKAQSEDWRGRRRRASDQLPVHKAILNAKKEEEKEQEQEKAREKLRDAVNNFRSLGKQIVQQTATCCGMATCPVEAFHRCAEGRFGLPQWELAKGEAYRSNRLEAAFNHEASHAQELSRSLFVGNRTDLGDRKVLRKTGLAHFSIRCIDPDPEKTLRNARPGVYASVLADLLFGRLAHTDDNRPLRTLDVTHLSSYECHDGTFAQFTCVGRLQREAIIPSKSPECAIKSVTITPYYGGMWEGYSEKLEMQLRQRFTDNEDERIKERVYKRTRHGKYDHRGDRFYIRWDPELAFDGMFVSYAEMTRTLTVKVKILAEAQPDFSRFKGTTKVLLTWHLKDGAIGKVVPWADAEASKIRDLFTLPAELVAEGKGCLIDVRFHLPQELKVCPDDSWCNQRVVVTAQPDLNGKKRGVFKRRTSHPNSLEVMDVRLAPVAAGEPAATPN